jgi:hypothetical protein
VIPKGSVQLENGIGWSTRHDASTIDASESLIRIGLTGHGEFRASFPVWYGTLRGEGGFGFSDILIGWKQQLAASGSFELAIAPAVSLPTGTHSFTSRGYAPQLDLAWSKSFNHRWSSSGVESFSYLKSPGSHFFETESVVAAERTLNSKVLVYVEYQGQFGTFTPTHIMEVGMSYRRRPNHQIDLLLGAGVSGGAFETAVGAGFSFRVGRHGGVDLP